MLEVAIERTRVRFCREMARKALKRCAKQFPRGFPDDMDRAVAALLPGFHVLELTHLPGDVSAIVSFADKAIGVNANLAPTLKRFSVAHEIGHVRLEHPHDVFDHTGRHDAIVEGEADLFAAELLVPLATLKRCFRLISRDPEELAVHFGVSRELMFRRYRESGLLRQIL
jgi:Zn-dependent peptidase ImmA (M78 family)